MKLKTLCDHLDREHIRYTVISHSPAFTAQEIAATSHISGREIAKTVIVRFGERLAMVVLPASARIDLALLADALGADHVALVAESEFPRIFPECETGAMPPFGNLYGLDVFVAEELTADDYIAFNAGTHTELLQLRYRDYERLAHPQVLACIHASA